MGIYQEYTLSLYLEIAFICLFVMTTLTCLVTLEGRRGKPENRRSNRRRTFTYISGTVMMLCETLGNINDYAHIFPRFLCCAVHIISCCALITASIYWVAYCTGLMRSPLIKSHLVKCLLFTPGLIICILSASSPWTGLMFTISADGSYVRGPIGFLEPVIVAVYILFSLVASVYSYRTTSNHYNRRRVKALFVAMLPIVIGTVLEEITHIPAIDIGASFSYGYLYVSMYAIATKQNKLLLTGLADDIDYTMLVNLDNDEIIFFNTDNSYFELELLEPITHRFSDFVNDFRTNAVFDEDREFYSKAVSSDAIRQKLLSGSTYRVTHRILQGDKPVYFLTKFVRVKPENDHLLFVLVLRNIDAIMRSQLEQHEALEYSLRRQSVYQRTLLVGALGFFECNLTKDLIIGDIFGYRNGEIVTINGELGLSTPCTYTEYSDFCSSLFIASKSTHDYMKQMTSREYILARYATGHTMHEVKFLSDSDLFKPAWNRLIYYISTDDRTGDVCALCVTRDISDEVRKEQEQTLALKEARNKAESANKAKSTFLFNMSHDIRTPMNAILGFTGMAKRSIDNKERVIDCLNKVELSGEHLLKLINDVLDMARIENGKITINENMIDIKKLMTQMINIIQASADEKHITLELSFGNITDNMIYADTLRINQILLNIISNSIKYTNENGRILVSIEQTACNVNGCVSFRIIISDNGIGMSDHFVNHIFEAFTREKSSTVSGIQGTGLGMSITKQLVDILGGTIDVSSTLGAGTTVTLELPFRNAGLYSEKERVEIPMEIPDFSGMRVLLVEDNELNREITRDILECNNLLVEEADDGSVAVNLYKEHESGYYNIILMDIQMPFMNGYRATELIRAFEKDRKVHVPIIAMTANAFEEDRKNALDAGMDDHIAKPINVAQFWQTMGRAIRNTKDSL